MLVLTHIYLIYKDYTSNKWVHLQQPASTTPTNRAKFLSAPPEIVSYLKTHALVK